MRILLVEDEDQIRKMVKLNLEMEGYEIVEANNGRLALEISEQQHFDMLLLDIMLPEVNGMDICRQVRLKNSQIPIIIISAKDTSSDRILGLKTGADDYLTKPFHLEELLLRIQKLLIRSSETAKKQLDLYSWDNNYLDFITFTAQSSLGNFQLTKKEALLLKLLVEKPNEVISRQQILQFVWGYDVFPSTRTIDNFILNFRKYFEKDPKSPKYFHSIRGVGYKFTP